MSKKKAETGRDRLRAVPLWQWGAIAIFAGVLANVAMGLQPAPSNRAAARGQALGRGVATGLFVVSGLGLILYDTLRKKPEPKRKSGKKRPPIED